MKVYIVIAVHEDGEFSCRRVFSSKENLLTWMKTEDLFNDGLTFPNEDPLTEGAMEGIWSEAGDCVELWCDGQLDWVIEEKEVE